jgi:hypothetical protein
MIFFLLLGIAVGLVILGAIDFVAGRLLSAIYEGFSALFVLFVLLTA